MGEKAEPKISLPEIIFIGIFLAVLDAIDLIPFAGDITDVFAAPLLFYYFFKNINGIAYGASLILDAIPFTQEFPTRSLVWWGTVIFDHFAPKQLAQTVQTIGSIEEGEGIEGGALEEEAAEGTVEATQAAEGAQMIQGGEETIEQAQGAEEGSRKQTRGSTEESGEEGQLDENEGGGENSSKKDAGDIQIGSEISPEEEAENTDFDSVEEQTPQDDDEEDEEEEQGKQSNNKVVDIRTRKPVNNNRNNASENEDIQKAA